MYCPDDRIGPRFAGHVLVRDAATGEVLRDVFNAIHLGNMSAALALSLADRSNGHIQSMAFGNGGSVVSAVGAISYLPPNVSGDNAALYNQTYKKVVNDLSPLNTDTGTNNLKVSHPANANYSDVQVTCTLDFNEPAGQAAYDDAPIVSAGAGAGSAGVSSSTFVFDELGLLSFDAATGAETLLSHVIFHPVQKALNRSIEVIYTVRIILA